MAEPVVQLTEAQRRTLGGVFARVERILLETRAHGFDSPEVAELEREVARVKEETAALVPPRRDDLPALLAELYVLIGEIRPRGLRAYGALPDETAAYVEQATARLEQLAGALIERAGSVHDERSADAIRADPGRDRR